MLDTLAAEMGRDPASLTITVYGQEANRAALQDLFNAGANRGGGAPGGGGTRNGNGGAVGAIGRGRAGLAVSRH